MSTPKVRRSLTEAPVLGDLHGQGVDKHSFTVYVSGDHSAKPDDDNCEPGVTFQMADRFERNLAFLSSINRARPVTVMLASNGGYWEEGMQMFGAMLTCPNPITVIGTKHCRSMTSIIPLAADRFLLRPPTGYMIHRGMSGFGGTEAECDAQDVQRRKDDELMLRIYVARLRETSRASEVRLKEGLQRQFAQRVDVWYDTNEAIEAGFVDGVYTGQRNAAVTKINTQRRKRMLDAISRPVTVTITVS